MNKRGFLILALLLALAVPVHAGTWLILIDEATYKAGTNNVGDIVEIYSNDAAPAGVGYEAFKCVEIPYMTAEQVRDVLANKMPERRCAFKSSAASGEWSFNPPEEAEFWRDGDDWKQVTDNPKYQFRVSDPDALVNSLTSAKDLSTRGSALIDALTVNLIANEDNQTVMEALSTATAVEAEATK